MRMLVPFCAVVLIAAVALADEKKDKEPEVKKLDLKGLKRDQPRGDVKKPTEITTAEELAKAFPEEEVLARLKKEVDFSKQKLLFFAWSGSGGDKLDYSIKDGKELVFTYKPGVTDDLRYHFHLFAMPKDLKWKMDK